MAETTYSIVEARARLGAIAREVSAPRPTLRLSRDLTETMGGTLEPAASGPAFAVTLTLPTAAPRMAAGR
ncbi:hypothetical protein [Streptomyces sp. NPDC048473]|uniref:hypothetical protein n=1 Tax=unclassified Streptomyces TaxID=2593676 RepID=UPI00371C63B7